jgi:ketosteroid isomerase-like protein
MRTLVVLSMLALAAIPLPAAENEAAAQARFRALELKLMDAVRANNVETIESLLSPEFAWSMSFQGRANVVESRSEWIKGGKHFDLKSFDIGNLVAEEFGKLALVHFQLNVAARMGKKTDMSGGYLATDLWQQTGKEWKLLRRLISRPAVFPHER